MAETKATQARQFDRELDVRGYTCPIPALRLRAALARMQSGQVLRVSSSDGDAPRDFLRFAQSTGHQLLDQSPEGDGFVFYFRKA